jgi:hypothetical protein
VRTNVCAANGALMVLLRVQLDNNTLVSPTQRPVEAAVEMSRLANDVVVNGASIRILEGRRVNRRSRLSTTATDGELRGCVSGTYHLATGRKGILLLVLSVLLVNIDGLLGRLAPGALLVGLGLLGLGDASLGTGPALLSRGGRHHLAVAAALAQRSRRGCAAGGDAVDGKATVDAREDRSGLASEGVSATVGLGLQERLEELRERKLAKDKKTVAAHQLRVREGSATYEALQLDAALHEVADFAELVENLGAVLPKTTSYTCGATNVARSRNLLTNVGVAVALECAQLGGERLLKNNEVLVSLDGLLIRDGCADAALPPCLPCSDGVVEEGVQGDVDGAVHDPHGTLLGSRTGATLLEGQSQDAAKAGVP